MVVLSCWRIKEPVLESAEKNLPLMKSSGNYRFDIIK
jgi:diphthamide synthase subunit DPH2